MTALSSLRPNQDTINLVAGLRGTWYGSYAMCCCPAHSDRTPSLSIRQGMRGILVHCFAGCQPRDVLRALRHISRVPDVSALHWHDATTWHEATTRKQAQRLWDQAQEVHGTLAERYLANRNLPVNLPDIRFLPRCPLGPKPRTIFPPALIVAVREARAIVAVQRIILDPATSQHRGKFLLGACGQGAWQQLLSGRTLAIAEGFEDAAAFTQIHGISCWAALGAARLPNLRLPDNIETLLIAEDNNGPGTAAAAKAMIAYARPGLVIERLTPAPAADWAAVNEALSTLRHG